MTFFDLEQLFMGEFEGVIKYRLDFLKSEPITENLDKLNTWRSILFGLGGIGQDGSRYEGYGFGNLSQRCELDKSQFIISGTQTGKLAVLTQGHYVCVEQCNVAQNHVIARGSLKPSSEALTHSMLYWLDSDIKCVIHVHSPELWHFGLTHDYACTDKSVEYGTQEMALEISRLQDSGKFSNRKILIMAGHEDGVMCFGDSVDQAAMAFVNLWVRSTQYDW